MAIHSSILECLDEIKSNKITQEIYLTEIVKIVNQHNKKITFVEIDEDEILGINNQLDLADAERISQNALRKKAMLNGVKLIAPETVFFNFDTKIYKDVVIHPNVVFGKNVVIGPLVEIKSFSYLEDCEIKKESIDWHLQD